MCGQPNARHIMDSLDYTHTNKRAAIHCCVMAGVHEAKQSARNSVYSQEGVHHEQQRQPSQAAKGGLTQRHITTRHATTPATTTAASKVSPASAAASAKVSTPSATATAEVATTTSTAATTQITAATYRRQRVSAGSC
jgi:hypothetical protein